MRDDGLQLTLKQHLYGNRRLAVHAVVDSPCFRRRSLSVVERESRSQHWTSLYAADAAGLRRRERDGQLVHIVVHDGLRLHHVAVDDDRDVWIVTEVVLNNPRLSAVVAGESVVLAWQTHQVACGYDCHTSHRHVETDRYLIGDTAVDRIRDDLLPGVVVDLDNAVVCV